jgi:hypothetical protein
LRAKSVKLPVALSEIIAVGDVSKTMLGSQNMRIAVITPYFKESAAILRQCHSSVVAQTHPCLHVMVADGSPNTELNSWDIDHIRLPRSHGDIGSTPRLIGSYHAIGLGIEAVAFLDADNWYRNDHIATLIALHRRTGASFLSSGRILCRLDGSLMGPCPNTDPEKFIDTSCMMFTREAFFLLANWGLMPAYAHLIGDRVMLHHVKSSAIKTAHSSETSVFYRCMKAGAYKLFGEAAPSGVASVPDYGTAHDKWTADGNPPLT